MYTKENQGKLRIERKIEKGIKQRKTEENPAKQVNTSRRRDRTPPCSGRYIALGDLLFDAYCVKELGNRWAGPSTTVRIACSSDFAKLLEGSQWFFWFWETSRKFLTRFFLYLFCFLFCFFFFFFSLFSFFSFPKNIGI